MIDSKDLSTFIDRRLDYLLRGLSGVESSTVFHCLEDIGHYNIQSMLEKEEGYPSLRELGYSDKAISKLEVLVGDRFKAVNDHLAKLNRCPFFEDPYDTFASAKEYLELLKKRPYQELVEYFGAEYFDYVPKTLK